MLKTTSFILASALAASVGAHAAEERYPQRPIRFIVPFAAGGTTDIIARIVGAKLGEQLGQQLIIDNRGGAGSTIGTALAAKATPDGYTILLGNNGLAINETLYSKLPYSALKDLAPIALIGLSPNVLVVNTNVPAKTVKDFIALAKAQPGKLSYASAGSGSSTHLSVELLKSVAGIDALHVPYKGGAPALADTISGQVQFMVATLPSAHRYIVSGRLRALGISGSERSGALPEVPTIAEAGLPGYEYTSWYGILAPSNTPKAIIASLNQLTGKALGNKDTGDKLRQQGLEPRPTTPEKFGEMIRSEMSVWAKIIKTAGIKVN